MYGVDKFKYLVGGYFGIKTIDEYPSKLYILKDLENYIREYIRDLNDDSVDYKGIANKIKEEATIREKLQDSLIVLNELNGPIELILIIKLKVKELKYHQ